MAAAASLLARACELLPREAPERVELLPKLGEALTWRGERATAREVFAEAHAVASELGDARLAARARVATLLALMWGDARVPPDQMLRDVEDAVARARAAPATTRALAMAEVVRFHALDRGGLPAPEERLSVALDHARKAGSGADRAPCHGLDLHHTAARGGVPADEAIARVAEIAETSHSAYVHASALGALGLLRATRGEFEEARALVEETRRTLEELGLRLVGRRPLDRGRPRSS